MTSSSNWKNFERRVAKFFGTKRILRGDDFGTSRPDIIAEVSSFMGSHSGMMYEQIVVECKYSQDQAWKRHLTDLSKGLDKTKTLIVQADKLVFWELQDTRQVLAEFSSTELHMEDVLDEFNILTTTRKVPKYLQDHLKQAEDYINELESISTLSIPLVALGHRGSSKVTVFTGVKYI